MKYDLKAMVFDPDSDSATAIDGVFFGWDETPEGSGYWDNHYYNPHQEGRDKIAAMLKQWKEEQAMTDDKDKIDGLQSDLNEAVEVAYNHGARLWVRNNYPDFTMTESTRPAIDVLHKHDGSEESPLPKGTDHTFWLRGGDIEREIDRGDADWDNVTDYLVHSYPETKQVTGTVTYTNGEPDLSTWTPNE